MYTWQIDQSQSTIAFRMSFCTIGLLEVKFRRFNDHIIAGKVCENPFIKLGLEAISLSTQNIRLDELLISDKYFAAANFPFIYFSAENGCRLKSDRVQELTGIINIKDICRPLTMVVTSSAVREDHQIPNARFTLVGSISLKDFNFPLYDELCDENVQIIADIKLLRLNPPVF